jgi:hypothetical protein
VGDCACRISNWIPLPHRASAVSNSNRREEEEPSPHAPGVGSQREAEHDDGSTQERDREAQVSVRGLLPPYASAPTQGDLGNYAPHAVAKRDRCVRNVRSARHGSGQRFRVGASGQARLWSLISRAAEPGHEFIDCDQNARIRVRLAPPVSDFLVRDRVKRRFQSMQESGSQRRAFLLGHLGGLCERGVWFLSASA